MAWWPHTQQVSVKKGSPITGKQVFIVKEFYTFTKQYNSTGTRHVAKSYSFQLFSLNVALLQIHVTSSRNSMSTLRQQVSNCPYAAIYGLKQRWRSSGRKITFQEFKFIFWGCCMFLDSARSVHLVSILVGNSHIFFLDQHLLYGILHRHSLGFVMPFFPRRQTPLYNLSLNITNVHFIVKFC